jgi:hypothetical protein
MKNRMNQIWKAQVIALAFSFTACVQSGGGGGAPTAAAPAPGAPEVASNPIVQQVVNVGIKNFDQINATFSALTGVASSTNAIANEFNALRTSLPSNNDIRTFSGAVQTAAMKLASRYCQEAINNAATRPNVIPGNLLRANNTPYLIADVFNATPAMVFLVGNNAKIAEFYIERFWNRDPAAEADADDAQLVQLINDLMAGEAATAAVTRNVLTGTCTAALANVNVLTM